MLTAGLSNKIESESGVWQHTTSCQRHLVKGASSKVYCAIIVKYKRFIKNSTWSHTLV